jgi:thiamine kinase-like enzyme
VPALPSGDFVHGDFSTRNLLADDRRLSTVIDIEGFGRGTRTIDLVSLLDSGAGPEDRTTTDLIVEAAIAASDEQTFRACLAHRVLASLISTPERPRRLTAVAERARALLALAG